MILFKRRDQSKDENILEVKNRRKFLRD